MLGRAAIGPAGGSSRHQMWLSTRSVSGSLTVKPRIPCWPGATPVANDARLVGVVEGKVQASSSSRPASPASTDASSGASAASSGSRCQPIPSTRTTTTRRTSPTHAVTPSASSAPSTESSAAAAGSTSQIEPGDRSAAKPGERVAPENRHDVSLTASDPVIGCDSTIGCVILDEWPGPRLWIRSSPSGSASCCALMGCAGWRPGSQSWQCSSRSTVICRLPRSTSGCTSACRPKTSRRTWRRSTAR